MASNNMPQPSSSTPSTHLDTQELLSISNQVAPRSFVHTSFCFPFEGDRNTYREVLEHFRTVLRNVAQEFPFLAGTITQDSSFNPAGQQGRLSLKIQQDDVIPLSCEFALEKFGMTYAELKSRGFPQAAFVGQIFTVPKEYQAGFERSSVLAVCLTFICGGIIMTIRNHHSLIDGGSRKRLFDCLAAYTRKETYDKPMTLAQRDSNERIEELLKKHT